MKSQATDADVDTDDEYNYSSDDISEDFSRDDESVHSEVKPIPLLDKDLVKHPEDSVVKFCRGMKGSRGQQVMDLMTVIFLIHTTDFLHLMTTKMGRILIGMLERIPTEKKTTMTGVRVLRVQKMTGLRGRRQGHPPPRNEVYSRYTLTGLQVWCHG